MNKYFASETFDRAKKLYKTKPRLFLFETPSRHTFEPLILIFLNQCFPYLNYFISKRREKYLN